MIIMCNFSVGGLLEEKLVQCAWQPYSDSIIAVILFKKYVMKNIYRYFCYVPCTTQSSKLNYP